MIDSAKNSRKKKVKVAYIVGGLPFGGVETWLYDLTRSAHEYAIDPVVINISGRGEMQKKIKEKGINVLTIGNSYKCINTHRIDTLFKLFFLLKKTNPDIIHTAHFSADYYGRLANIFIGKPIFTHLRNIKIEKKIWRKIANKILSLFTTAYIAVSKDVAERCIQKYHNRANKPVHILYNMIDINKFSQEKIKPPFPSEKKIIVGLGRLVAQKNFDLLIKGFALCSSSLPHIYLTIIGEGPERQSLENLARELGIKKNVEFMGYREDVPSILPFADLIVMPSAYEGFGIAFLEAMYCGVPGILSENTPIKEIAGECSLITDTTPEDISQKIIKFLTDDEFYNQCSKKAREIAAEHTVENYIPNLLEIYNKYRKTR